MFKKDREWLQRQPGMNPWAAGCSRLKEQLDRWAVEYSEPLCERVAAADQPDLRAYTGRLWGCWGYHWHQASEISPDNRIDGSVVAEKIRSGRGYARGGQLGGDPLRDVVLAVAMVLKDNRATSSFQSEYFESSRRMAGKVNRRFFLDPDDWWNEFLDFLAGYTKPSAKLDRFTGKCALQNWLPTVLWNFLRRRPLPEGAAPNGPPDGQQSPVDDLARKECLDLFAELIKQALDGLPSEDKLLLAMIYIDGLKQKEVAQVLGVHPGQISRRHAQAIERFQRSVAKHLADSQQEEEYQDCAEYLMDDPTDFAAALREALEDIRRTETES